MALIDFRRKFIFLKTKKVAGTSVEALIRPHLDEDAIIPAITPRDELYCLRNGAPSRNYLANQSIELEYQSLVLEQRFQEAAQLLSQAAKIARSHMRYDQLEKLVAKRGLDIKNFYVF